MLPRPQVMQFHLQPFDLLDVIKSQGNWNDYRQSGASLSVDICGEIGEGFFSPPPSLKGCGAFACSLTHLFLSLKNPTLVTLTVGIKSLKRFFRA